MLKLLIDLSKKGMKVEHAQDGGGSQALLSKSALDIFDLILMDMRMLNMGGVENSTINIQPSR